MPAIDSNTLILVDGSSYLFRAYYALPPLNNSKGMPTGAIYGVINMLKKLLADHNPKYIAIVFDPKGKTFRHDLYPDYKANRRETPKDLIEQIPPLYELIKALGLPLIIEDHVEADDVIAALTKEALKLNKKVLIITGDKDLAQLVNDKVTLLDTMRNRTFDIKGVQEKFGVLPEQIVDYLTLVGDTSDNVPGVMGVGPKTAAKWLSEYKTLDNLIQHVDDIKGKVGENLKKSLPQLALTKKLITVKDDIKIKEHINDLVHGEQKIKTLEEILEKLEFNSWLKEIHHAHPQIDSKKTKSAYETILNEKTFDTWLEKLKHAKQFALDTETTSLDSMQAELVGLSFAVKSGEAAYLPVKHDYLGAPKQLPKKEVLKKLQAILNEPHKLIIGQNLKYDLKVLRNEGIEFFSPMFDTMLASYVLNATEKHDLDSLALKYLQHQNITFEEVAGKGAKQISFNQVSLEKASDYAAEDADVTFQLYQTFESKLNQDEHLKKVFDEIEMPLMPVLMQMEYTGVLVDTLLLEKQSTHLEKLMKSLEEKIYSEAGETFNIDSPKQLQEILYDKLKLPIFKKTPGGQASTAEPVLQELALDYPLPKFILDYRSCSKLKSTYTDKLPKLMNPKTGRIHTSYRQSVTSTGRLSSQDPNLQNIPIRTEMGREIRKAFIAPENRVIIAADYSQIELRIMAHLSQDKNLLKAFAHHLDIHRATASEVFGVDLDKVTDLQRRRAKAINFGLIYGMSAFGLAKQIGVDRITAEKYIQIYFERYPAVKHYMEDIRKLAAKQGYVETLFGRKVYLPDIHSKNFSLRLAAERAAINAPMQGTAADIIKLAMISLHGWIQKTKAKISMIMQVHDELVFEAEKETCDEMISAIRQHMEHVDDLDVELLVEIGKGKNWDEAH